MASSFQTVLKRDKILVYTRPCIFPASIHPNDSNIYIFNKIFIWWFWSVSIVYYSLFFLHFLCGHWQTREMESQWGEEVGRNKDDHQKAEKAAGEGNFTQLYFALGSIILIFFGFFFFCLHWVYLHLCDNFFFSDITLFTENTCGCL